MEKSILITNYELMNYTGSELNAMSIAKRFKDLGYKVYVLAMFIGEPLYSKTRDCYDEIINIVDDEFDFSNIEFDIVWAHHSFLLSWLIFEKQLKAKKIIVSSLSARENFEMIPKYANDLSLVLANSQETKQQLEQEGIKEVYVLENYSFKNYFERNIGIKKLKNIAIISNHVPEELMKTKEMLESNGYGVQIYGFTGKRELITDTVLEQYDAIITIGKTVQYAMSLKIPVYVYDIFGGEGYLTLENLEKNRSRNFSGRGFDKKTPEIIYKEITQNFKNTLDILEELKQYALKNFCFENNIDKICEIIEQKPDINLDDFREQHKGEKRESMLAKQMFINITGKYIPIVEDLEAKEQEIKNLNIRSQAQEAAKENLQKEKENIEKEYMEFRNKIESQFSYRVKQKIGRMTGGKAVEK